MAWGVSQLGSHKSISFFSLCYNGGWDEKEYRPLIPFPWSANECRASCLICLAEGTADGLLKAFQAQAAFSWAGGALLHSLYSGKKQHRIKAPQQSCHFSGKLIISAQWGLIGWCQKQTQKELWILFRRGFQSTESGFKEHSHWKHIGWEEARPGWRGRRRAALFWSEKNHLLFKEAAHSHPPSFHQPPYQEDVNRQSWCTEQCPQDPAVAMTTAVATAQSLSGNFVWAPWSWQRRPWNGRTTYWKLSPFSTHFMFPIVPRQFLKIVVRLRKQRLRDVKSPDQSPKNQMQVFLTPKFRPSQVQNPEPIFHIARSLSACWYV